MNKDLVIKGAIIFTLLVLFSLIIFFSFKNINKDKEKDLNTKIEIPEIEAKRAEYNSQIDFLDDNRKIEETKETIFSKFENNKQTPYDNENQELDSLLKEVNTQQNITQHNTSTPTKKTYNPAPTKVVERVVEKVVEKVRRKKRRFSNQKQSSKTKTTNSNKILTYTTDNIPVKIHSDYRKIRNRSKIIVRTSDTCTIKDKAIPRNTLLSGITNFSQNKILLKITAIHLNGEIIPTNFSAYSLDGVEGIWVEGANLDDNKKDVNSELIEEAANRTKIPIVGGVIKSIVKKGNKEIEVYLPSNYPLILKRNY